MNDDMTEPTWKFVKNMKMANAKTFVEKKAKTNNENKKLQRQTKTKKMATKQKKKNEEEK